MTTTQTATAPPALSRLDVTRDDLIWKRDPPPDSDNYLEKAGISLHYYPYPHKDPPQDSNNYLEETDTTTNVINNGQLQLPLPIPAPLSPLPHYPYPAFPHRQCSPPLKHLTPEATQELLATFDPADLWEDSTSERSASSSTDTMIMMTTEEERNNAARIRTSLLRYEASKASASHQQPAVAPPDLAPTTPPTSTTQQPRSSSVRSPLAPSTSLLSSPSSSAASKVLPLPTGSRDYQYHPGRETSHSESYSYSANSDNVNVAKGPKLNAPKNQNRPQNQHKNTNNILPAASSSPSPSSSFTGTAFSLPAATRSVEGGSNYNCHLSARVKEDYFGPGGDSSSSGCCDVNARHWAPDEGYGTDSRSNTSASTSSPLSAGFSSSSSSSSTSSSSRVIINGVAFDATTPFNFPLSASGVISQTHSSPPSFPSSSLPSPCANACSAQAASFSSSSSSSSLPSPTATASAMSRGGPIIAKSHSPRGQGPRGHQGHGLTSPSSNSSSQKPPVVFLAAKRRDLEVKVNKDTGSNLEDRLRALTTIQEEELSLMVSASSRCGDARATKATTDQRSKNSYGLSDIHLNDSTPQFTDSSHGGEPLSQAPLPPPPPLMPSSQPQVQFTTNENDSVKLGDGEDSSSTGFFRAVPIHVVAAAPPPPPPSWTENRAAKSESLGRRVTPKDDGSIASTRLPAEDVMHDRPVTLLPLQSASSQQPTSSHSLSQIARDRGWEDYTRYFEKDCEIPLRNIASSVNSSGKFINVASDDALASRKDINKQRIGTTPAASSSRFEVFDSNLDLSQHQKPRGVPEVSNRRSLAGGDEVLVSQENSAYPRSSRQGFLLRQADIPMNFEPRQDLRTSNPSQMSQNGCHDYSSLSAVAESQETRAMSRFQSDYKERPQEYTSLPLQHQQLYNEQQREQFLYEEQLQQQQQQQRNQWHKHPQLEQQQQQHVHHEAPLQQPHHHQSNSPHPHHDHPPHHLEPDSRHAAYHDCPSHQHQPPETRHQTSSQQPASMTTSHDELMSLSRSLSKQYLQQHEMLQQQQQQQQYHQHHHPLPHPLRPYYQSQTHDPDHQPTPTFADSTSVSSPDQSDVLLRNPYFPENAETSLRHSFSHDYSEVLLRNSKLSSSTRSLSSQRDRYSWHPESSVSSYHHPLHHRHRHPHQQQQQGGQLDHDRDLHSSTTTTVSRHPHRVSLDLGTIPQIQRQIRATSEMCLQMSKRHHFASSADIYKLFQGQKQPQQQQPLQQKSPHGLGRSTGSYSPSSFSNNNSNNDNTGFHDNEGYNTARGHPHRHSFHSMTPSEHRMTLHPTTLNRPSAKGDSNKGDGNDNNNNNSSNIDYPMNSFRRQQTSLLASSPTITTTSTTNNNNNNNNSIKNYDNNSHSNMSIRSHRLVPMNTGPLRVDHTLATQVAPHGWAGSIPPAQAFPGVAGEPSSGSPGYDHLNPNPTPNPNPNHNSNNIPPLHFQRQSSGYSSENELQQIEIESNARASRKVKGRGYHAPHAHAHDHHHQRRPATIDLVNPEQEFRPVNPSLDHIGSSSTGCGADDEDRKINSKGTNNNYGNSYNNNNHNSSIATDNDSNVNEPVYVNQRIIASTRALQLSEAARRRLSSSSSSSPSIQQGVEKSEMETGTGTGKEEMLPPPLLTLSHPSALRASPDATQPWHQMHDQHHQSQHPNPHHHHYPDHHQDLYQNQFHQQHHQRQTQQPEYHQQHQQPQNNQQQHKQQQLYPPQHHTQQSLTEISAPRETLTTRNEGIEAMKRSSSGGGSGRVQGNHSPCDGRQGPLTTDHQRMTQHQVIHLTSKPVTITSFVPSPSYSPPARQHDDLPLPPTQTAHATLHPPAHSSTPSTFSQALQVETETEPPGLRDVIQKASESLMGQQSCGPLTREGESPSTSSLQLSPVDIAQKLEVPFSTNIISDQGGDRLSTLV